jgi:hypothetical protein
LSIISEKGETWMFVLKLRQDLRRIEACAMRLFLLALTLGTVTAAFVAPPSARADTPLRTAVVGVGSQYDTTHVYVAPEELNRFVASFLATFGGRSTPQAVTTVTPTPSKTVLTAVFTPVGIVSTFGFTTPIPYPFGAERTGYLVTDMDTAIRAARANGADIVVTPFNDPIGIDAIIEWPGGIFMQLYWHRSAPHYAPLTSVPENRVYVSMDKADKFIKDFVDFAHGKILSDNARASGIEIGSPSETYRRVRIESVFGKMTVLVTNGHLAYPYGRETTGYEVINLADTLEKAKSSGATILVAPYTADGREAAIVQFPGGYIAEIHSSVSQ